MCQPCSHKVCMVNLLLDISAILLKQMICLDFVEPIFTDFTQPDYHEIAEKLKTSCAKVVVVLTNAEHTEPLMRKVQDVSMTLVKTKGGSYGLLVILQWNCCQI